MSYQRISLQTNGLADRIRKFDTYQHNVKRSERPVFNLSHDISLKTTKPSAARTATARKKIVASSFSTHQQPAQELHTSTTQNLILHAVANSPAQQSARFADEFEEASLIRRILHNSLTKWQKAFYGFGLAVFLFAAAVSVHTLINNSKTKEQLEVLGAQTTDAQGVSEGTGDEPSESEVPAGAIANYAVSPELPRYLRIPKLNVFARIKHTGLTPSGAVDAPTNIHDVSWFNESAKPGNPIGSSLILGHVQGWTAPGVFKHINQLKAGDRFEIEKGSGEKLTYEVVRGEQLPAKKINMAKVLGSEVAGQHDLKLMTCGGRYDPSIKQYLDRYVVYAKILR